MRLKFSHLPLISHNNDGRGEQARFLEKEYERNRLPKGQKLLASGDCFFTTRYDLAGSNRPGISLLWQRPNDIGQKERQMGI